MARRVSGIIARLKANSSPQNAAGMARFGINAKGTIGVPIPVLRGMAKSIGRDHAVARGLWASGIHEARILAAMTDEPEKVTPGQMDRWAADFDSWDVCDQACSNLFDRTPHAYGKAAEWAGDSREFVKRAGFAMMACLAVHDKAAPDAPFEKFLEIAVDNSRDKRNFVRKAVNWALRQVGKRNGSLRTKALESCGRILDDPQSVRWIALDARRELAAIK